MSTILGRLLRFGAVGVVNTGVHFVIYLAAQTALPYLLAHIIAFAVALTGSYFLNCRFTFHVEPSWRGFLLFPLSNVTNLVVTTTGLYVLVEFFGVPAWIAPLPTAVIAIPVTFLVAQFLLVGRTERAQRSDAPAPPEHEKTRL